MNLRGRAGGGLANRSIAPESAKPQAAFGLQLRGRGASDKVLRILVRGSGWTGARGLPSLLFYNSEPGCRSSRFVRVRFHSVVW